MEGSIDLNVDYGEGPPFEVDEALLDLVTSANIAAAVTPEAAKSRSGQAGPPSRRESPSS